MTSLKRLFAPLGGLALSLTACATDRTSLNTCPPITEYSAAFMINAADELDAAIAAGATAIPIMLEDYKRERDMLRACR